MAGDWIDEIVKFRPEWCIHLAWDGLPDYSLERCRTNLDASLRLLDVLTRSGLRKMIIAGSCWEYGQASGAATEDHHPTELSVFAATKRALHRVVDSVARHSEFQYCWARIFFVYGPGQRATSLIPAVRAAYAAGRSPDIREPEAAHDFVYVEDVAAALVALAASDAPSGVFNIGGGHATSVGQVANKVADYYGKPRPFDPAPAECGFWADTAKIRKATGWQARVGLDDGLGKTLAALDGRR